MSTNSSDFDGVFINNDITTSDSSISNKLNVSLSVPPPVLLPLLTIPPTPYSNEYMKTVHKLEGSWLKCYQDYVDRLVPKAISAEYRVFAINQIAEKILVFVGKYAQLFPNEVGHIATYSNEFYRKSLQAQKDSYYDNPTNKFSRQLHTLYDKIIYELPDCFPQSFLPKQSSDSLPVNSTINTVDTYFLVNAIIFAHLKD